MATRHVRDAGAIIRFLAAALVLASGALGASAGSASAASCYGDYCSGKNPMATGCAADAETIAVRDDIVGARLDMRWSRTCKTAWARWQQYLRGWNLGTVLLTLRTVQDTGYTQYHSWDDGGGPGDNTTTWSPMVCSPTRAHRQANDHAVDMEMKLPASDHRHHAAEPEKQMENQLGTDRCA
jgi:hypothetical protein